MECLEFKNQDKVYYTPLFGLPPPYFRQAKRFDSFDIIEKFNKELSALDNRDNGFVSVALFKSLLEHELKIKEKIVADFVCNMRESDTVKNPVLDVNLESHSFKNHLDYVVLLRKVVHYFEMQPEDKNGRSSAVVEKERHSGYGDINLRIDIESAMRLRNPLNELEPPNAFVQLRSPFVKSSPPVIITTTINKSSYPAWHC